MCVQVAASSAQNVAVNITSFSVTSAMLYYGQNQTYGAEVTSEPLIPGPFLWRNATHTIATLPNLDDATTSSVFEDGIVSAPHPPPCALSPTLMTPMAAHVGFHVAQRDGQGVPSDPSMAALCAPLHQERHTPLETL
jgi:hypothetical protein